jgi:hypothetical protein
MKSSPRVNVKVAIFKRDQVVERLKYLVLLAFAMVFTAVILQMQMAAILDLAF